MVNIRLRFTPEVISESEIYPEGVPPDPLCWPSEGNIPGSMCTMTSPRVSGGQRGQAVTYKVGRELNLALRRWTGCTTTLKSTNISVRVRVHVLGMRVLEQTIDYRTYGTGLETSGYGRTLCVIPEFCFFLR